MRWLAFAALFLASACGGSKSGSDGGGAGGGSSGGGDLASTSSDMARSIAGIACGPTSACITSAQLCCSSDSGKSGDCEMTTAGTCTAATFYCDGPEDCPPALHECCFQASTAVGGGASQCQSSGYCATQVSGQLMCHADADCGAMRKCCPTSGSPYAFCKSSC